MKFDTFSFILKVLGGSLIIAIAIKYLAPFVEVEPTTVNVLFAVLSPTFIVAIILLTRINSRNG